LGNNGWYVGTPSTNTSMQISLGFPGGAESGIVAVWYDTGIYGTKGGALSLEAYLDSPTNSILGWKIFQTGSASFGVDATQFTDPIITQAPGLEWDFYGNQPKFTVTDTSNNTWTRLVLNAQDLELWTDAPENVLTYDGANKYLDGKSRTRGVNWINPVNAQDLVTKNYVDSNMPVIPKAGQTTNAELLGTATSGSADDFGWPFFHRQYISEDSPSWRTMSSIKFYVDSNASSARLMIYAWWQHPEVTCKINCNLYNPIGTFLGSSTVNGQIFYNLYPPVWTTVGSEISFTPGMAGLYEFRLQCSMDALTPNDFNLCGWAAYSN